MESPRREESEADQPEFFRISSIVDLSRASSGPVGIKILKFGLQFIWSAMAVTEGKYGPSPSFPPERLWRPAPRSVQRRNANLRAVRERLLTNVVLLRE